MRPICRYIPLFALPLCLMPFCNAQSSFDVNLGFGTAQVGSNGSGIDSAASTNAFGTCSPSSGGSATLSQPAAAEPKPMVTQGYAVGRRNASPFSRIRILSFGAHHAGHATNADCNVRRVTYTLIANGVA